MAVSPAAESGLPEGSESLKRKADQIDAVDFERAFSRPSPPRQTSENRSELIRARHAAPQNGQVDIGATDVAGEDESDDDVGPMPLPATDAAVATKKRKGAFDHRCELIRRLISVQPAVLKHEKLYLDHLPAADRYYKSLMHRDTLSQVAVTKCVTFTGCIGPR